MKHVKKLLLLYNPVAGSGNIAGSLSDLIDFYTKNDYLVTVHPTQFPGDARAFLEQNADAFERVVVAGGDGLIHESINGLALNPAPGIFGVIPRGTANDFAASCRISSVLETAAAHSLMPAACIDEGLFNGERFSYVAAFGLGTSVSYETSQTIKNRFGMLAYIVKAMKETDLVHWENNCVSADIEWEGGSASGDFLFGSFSNSRYIAGSDLFTRRLFDAQDGLLEGCFIRRPMSLPELNSIVASLTRQDDSNPLIIQVQSPWFSIQTKEPIKWTLDGEFGGLCDQAQISVLPGALKIALPVEDV